MICVLSIILYVLIILAPSPGTPLSYAEIAVILNEQLSKDINLVQCFPVVDKRLEEYFYLLSILCGMVMILSVVREDKQDGLGGNFKSIREELVGFLTKPPSDEDAKHLRATRLDKKVFVSPILSVPNGQVDGEARDLFSIRRVDEVVLFR